MLPVGALAVAVLLNGAQILLPAPAFVEQGRTWAPARAILQRVGHKVRWDPAQQAMTVELGGKLAVFALGEVPTLDGQPLPTELGARRVEGTIYVPLQALRALGLRVMWDEGGKQVLLRAPLGLAAPTLAAILADPLAWSEQEVSLVGEYLGWNPYRFSFATRGGPPVSSGDWILHNEDGALYCSPGPVTPDKPTTASLSQITSPLPAFTPYAALGQRLSVTGTIKLTRQAVPYLEFARVSRPTGLAGVTCRLVLDRLQYRPGETVTWRVQIANPQATRVSLEGAAELLVSVADPEGSIFVVKRSLSAKTKEGNCLAPSEEIALEGSWELPATAAGGTYMILGRLSDQLGTYRRHFDVQPAEPDFQPSRHGE